MSKLKKKLDTIFSRYIRLRDPYCVTCAINGKSSFTEDAGHFISRRWHGTRWEPTNVHGQCVECNQYKKGNMPAYEKFMLKKYGKEQIWLLEARKNQYIGFRGADYIRMIEIYKGKIKELENA